MKTISEQAPRLNATEQTAVHARARLSIRCEVQEFTKQFISWMLGGTIVLVIAPPVHNMIWHFKRLTGEEKSDFYRALMTFGVIIVVGVVVVYLIAFINATPFDTECQ